MKILKNNFNKDLETNDVSYPRKLVCNMCDSELEYEESDMRMGVYGCMHIDCPLCGEDNLLEDNENNIELTKDNIEFPTHFHHVSTETGAAAICNNKNVKEYIHKAIDYFRKNKEEYNYGGWITGDFYINVHRYSDDKEYTVTVSNNFYEIEIPFEDEDY